MTDGTHELEFGSAETISNLFSQRVVDHWNHLLREIIDADSANSFRSRLDKFWQKTTDV